MERKARLWLMQQLHKRECTCPKWWQWETEDVLWFMLMAIWYERGEI